MPEALPDASYQALLFPGSPLPATGGHGRELSLQNNIS